MSDTNSPSSSLESAILQTIAYADIFDFPLTVDEIHRYLSVPATHEQVAIALNEHPFLRSALASHDNFYCLAGKESIIQTRQQRTVISNKLWSSAKDYGRRIGRLPFVRMVAVTGSLAANNADPASDIDYLIVTEPKRLWLCRLFVIMMVKWAQFKGHTICPNYFLSENALEIQEWNLFTAREIIQMTPIHGQEIYGTLRDKNRWVADFLPNADSPPAHKRRPAVDGMIKRVSEAVFRTPIGSWLEKWEMNRKIRKLAAQNPASEEACFSPDYCKGHFDGHAGRIMNAYRVRLDAIDYESTPITDLVEL